MERNLKEALEQRRKLLLAQSRIPDSRRRNRRNRALRRKTYAVGFQLAVLAAGAAVARPPCGLVAHRQTSPANRRPAAGLRPHRRENRPELRLRIRYGALPRGHRGCRRTATAVPALCRQFSDMVRAHFGHAPARRVDVARRGRLRSLAATLQSAHRRGCAPGVATARKLAADRTNAVRDSGRGSRRKDIQPHKTSGSGYSDSFRNTGCGVPLRKNREISSEKFGDSEILPTFALAIRNTPCGNSSVGRAQPCRG